MRYLLLAILIIAAPMAIADDLGPASSKTVIESDSDIGLYCNYLGEEVGMQQGDAVPSYVPYGNERINLYDLHGNSNGHVITEQKVVTSIGCEELNESTYHVSIASTDTIQTIFYSEEPLSELDEQKTEGNVIVEGQSFRKQVKKSLSFAGIAIMSWFGL